MLLKYGGGMNKLVINEKEAAQIIKVLKDRPCTIQELANITGKSFAAMRVLIDTLSFDYPIAQEDTLYLIQTW
jgi:CRISPR/Cas system-associated protein endoribonuclease Cas2